MRGRLWFSALIVAMAATVLGPAPEAVARSEGTLTVAVATVGNERWLPRVDAKVGEWPLIPGHMGFHSWEYVTRAVAR